MLIPLDITLTPGAIIILSIILGVILLSLYSTNRELSKKSNELSLTIKDKESEKSIEKNTLESNIRELIQKQATEKIELQNKFNEQQLEFQKKEAELKVVFQNWAIEELEKFKKNEIQKIQKTAEENSIKAASVVLQKWKIETEAKIRQDAINRSYAVNLGKITEHLVPFHQTFLSQFNPKDARFIGSPIDLIVFDGYADKKEEIILYFVEIKSGNSKLTETQKKIKASIKNAQVRWAEINPDNPNSTIIETVDLNT